jgi:hypothetical protein
MRRLLVADPINVAEEHCGIDYRRYPEEGEQQDAAPEVWLWRALESVAEKEDSGR